MKTPRKHAELIKEWADGAEIESQLPSGAWAVCHDPYWGENSVYRIKPEPKPDVFFSLLAEITDSQMWSMSSEPSVKKNLKLTFDGITGKLKSAEVL